MTALLSDGRLNHIRNMRSGSEEARELLDHVDAQAATIERLTAELLERNDSFRISELNQQIRSLKASVAHYRTRASIAEEVCEALRDGKFDKADSALIAWRISMGELPEDLSDHDPRGVR